MKENLKELNILIKNRKFILSIDFIDNILKDIQKHNDLEELSLEFDYNFQKALYLPFKEDPRFKRN